MKLANLQLNAPTTANSQTTNLIKPGESPELIIAFSGAIGAGIADVIPAFREVLSSYGYRVPGTVKVSELIREHAPRLLEKIDRYRGRFDNLENLGKLRRYETFQHAGNALRDAYGNSILAQLTVARLALDETRQGTAGNNETKPERVVYLIDSLKHQEEVHFLRKIYGNNFYLIGILSSELHRISRLKIETGSAEPDVRVLSDRDRKEEIDHGQQLDKALKLADFFIRNSPGSREDATRQVRRYCELIHGGVNVTPTTDEFGMYVAYSSGLASACMSRQVGAAILKDDSVLATGCNDVPKAGGGQYPNLVATPTPIDHRCVMSDGLCHNDREKNDIKEQIEKILENEGVANAAELADKIKRETRLADLIEFSRAVHAEMDALMAVARHGGISVQGATLYTTTYPCHNCARHILASGLSRVLFIEPYEKSLAVKLHSDAIDHDGDPGAKNPYKIPFLHFEGVAPRRYQELFQYPQGRKLDGRRLENDFRVAGKKIPQLMDDYRTLEASVVDFLISEELIVVSRKEKTSPPSAA